MLGRLIDDPKMTIAHQGIRCFTDIQELRIIIWANSISLHFRWALEYANAVSETLIKLCLLIITKISTKFDTKDIDVAALYISAHLLNQIYAYLRKLHHDIWAHHSIKGPHSLWDVREAAFSRNHRYVSWVWCPQVCFPDEVDAAWSFFAASCSIADLHYHKDMRQKNIEGKKTRMNTWVLCRK